tara:strand:+ start:63 stop:707 length:645 start_codon:yes stop_codon:yes gene_type:complete
MAAISSSLFNLGIILLVFSAIIYIIKNKLTEMDKRIDSLSAMTEELLTLINNKNTNNNFNIAASPATATTGIVVSDDDDDDDDDDEHDDDDDEDEDQDEEDDVDGHSGHNDDDHDEDDGKCSEDDNIKIVESLIQSTDIIKNENMVHEINIQDDKEVLGISLDSDISIEKKAEDKKEKDYNSMNVKELKKIVSENGGKVSGKTKEELLNFLNNI